MAKQKKIVKKPKTGLMGPKNSKIVKLTVKQNGVSHGKKNRKRSKEKLDSNELNWDDSVAIRKKPSKVELKSVILALKKEASLLIVRKALKYVPYYLKSEGLTKKLLKEVIRLWSEASEKIRIICLLCLIRIYTKLHDDEKKETVIKKLYLTFLEKCRVTKYETMSMIGFMRHSLIELYKIDLKIAYKQAQSSCQQLSITLKTATTHKNEESYKSVLNWQFANCLVLLSQLVASQGQSGQISSLSHQVIQLNLGAINLLTSPRYYPYYCHLIENLVHLSKCAKVFIPILPVIVNILRRLSFPLDKKEKRKEQTKMMVTNQSKTHDLEGSEQDEEGTSDLEDESEKEVPKKGYNIELLNHVSLDEVHNPEYCAAVLDKLHELMIMYLASQCNKIAFPELVFLPCVHLKKWLKNNPGRQTQKVKTLLQKVKSDCAIIEEERKCVDFEFTNYNAVDAWEKKVLDLNKLGLPRLYNQIRQQ